MSALCGLNLTAIAMFVLFVALTPAVNWRAASVSTSRDAFCTGGGISGLQNGLAMDRSGRRAASLREDRQATGGVRA